MIDAIGGVVTVDIAVAITIGGDRASDRAGAYRRRGGQWFLVGRAGAQTEQTAGDQCHASDFHNVSLKAPRPDARP
jgi:hypothetical protein